MDEEFSKRMSAAAGKQRVIELAKDCNKILDLGAGNGIIAKALADIGKEVDAVEIDPNVKKPANVKWHTCDIIDFLWKTRKQFDCIIISAVLHELSPYEISLIGSYMKDVMLPECKIIIREPFITDYLLNEIYAYDKKFLEMSIAEKKKKEYFKAEKKGRDVDEEDVLDLLNCAFAISYGERSWAREKHEMRYCHKLEPVIYRLNAGFRRIAIELEKDESYKTHFSENGLAADILNKVNYTSMIVVLTV